MMKHRWDLGRAQSPRIALTLALNLIRIREGSESMRQRLILITCCVVIGTAIIIPAIVKAQDASIAAQADKVRNLLEHNEVNLAIILLADVLKTYPTSIDILNLLGDSYSRLGVSDEARRFFEQAVALDPSNVEALVGLARTLLSQGNVSRAKQLFQKCVDVNPEAAEAHGYLGQLFLEEGQLDEARSHFESVLTRHPDDIDALNGLGIVYQRAGIDSKAEVYFKLLVEQHPNEEVGHVNLGVLYGAMGRVHDAVVQLNKASAISPLDKRPYQYLGILYLRNKIVPEAEKNFLKVLTIDPLNVDARFGLVVLCQEQQKLDEALRLVTEMEVLAPEYPQLHLIIANVHFLRGEYDSAITHAQKQVLCESEEPAGHYMLGVLYRLKGLTSDADWEFDQVKYLTGKEPAESGAVTPQSFYNSLGKQNTIGGRK